MPNENELLVALRNLRIDEISAVDFPAHLADGWVVMKAAPKDTEWQRLLRALSGYYSDTPWFKRLTELVANLPGDADEPISPDLLAVKAEAFKSFKRDLRATLAAQQLTELRDSDPRARQVIRDVTVDVLSDVEHVALSKFTAGTSAPSAPPVVKSHNGHEAQLRSPDGRWRGTVFRVANTRPKFGGIFFK